MTKFKKYILPILKLGITIKRMVLILKGSGKLVKCKKNIIELA